MKEDPENFVAAMKLMKNGLAYPQFRKGELNHKTTATDRAHGDRSGEIKSAVSLR